MGVDSIKRFDSVGLIELFLRGLRSIKPLTQSLRKAIGDNPEALKALNKLELRVRDMIKHFQEEKRIAKKGW